MMIVRDVPDVGELMLASFTNDLKFTLSAENLNIWYLFFIYY